MLELISKNYILNTNDDSFINKINFKDYPHEKLNVEERYSELNEYKFN